MTTTKNSNSPSSLPKDSQQRKAQGPNSATKQVMNNKNDIAKVLTPEDRATLRIKSPSSSHGITNVQLPKVPSLKNIEIIDAKLPSKASHLSHVDKLKRSRSSLKNITREK